VWGWADSHRDAVAILSAGLAVLLIAVAGFGVVTLVIALVLGAVAAWALITAERDEASLGSGPTVPPAAT
jgi:phage-related minor tail protein